MTPDKATVPPHGERRDRPADETAARKVNEKETTSKVEYATDTDAEPRCPHCGHTLPDDVMTMAFVKVLRAARRARGGAIRTQSYLDAFAARWYLPVPPRWRTSLKGLRNAGLPRAVMLECASIALEATHVPPGRRFTYFAGIAWKHVRDMDGETIERATGDGD